MVNSNIDKISISSDVSQYLREGKVTSKVSTEIGKIYVPVQVTYSKKLTPEKCIRNMPKGIKEIKVIECM